MSRTSHLTENARAIKRDISC